MSDEFNEIQFCQLLARLCDDTLSPEEIAGLEETLRNEPRATALYISYLEVHTSLAWDYSDSSKVDESGDYSGTTPAADIATEMPARPLVEAIHWKRNPLGFLATAAVLTVVFWSGWLLIIRQGNPPTAERSQGDSGAIPVEAPIVGRLVRTVGTEWNGSAGDIQDGTALRRGATLSLASGLADVRFRNGAQVILEGPAEFVLLDSGLGRLEHGKLVAHVTTDQAKGFTVDTPRGRVEDLGTEFGLQAGQAGDMHIEVFQGRVLFSHKDDDTSPITLRSGQSLSIAANTRRAVVASGSALEFVRKLEASRAGAIRQSYAYGFDALQPGPLNGQDNWRRLQGSSNIIAATTGDGWSGPVAEAHGEDSISIRPNDRAFAFYIPDNVHFDLSAKVAVYGNDFYAHAGTQNGILLGVDRANFVWRLGSRKYLAPHGVLESGDVSSTFVVGVSVKALGRGTYAAQRYFRNVDAGEHTTVGDPIIFRATPSHWDQLVIRMHNDRGILHNARLDDIRISPPVAVVQTPETTKP